MFEYLGKDTSWKVCSLGDFLSIKNDAWINIDDDTDYRILGVTAKGGGLAVKRTVTGLELKMREYQVARLNQLMWCKVDTTNGAFGITKPEHIGALSSPNMALADIDTEICLSEFLLLFFKLPAVYDGLTSASLGTTNRQYLKPQELLRQVRFHLPSLTEQRRILTRIEALAVRVTAAQSLRREASEEAAKFFISALNQVFTKLEKEHSSREIQQVCEVVRGGSPRPAGDIRFYGGDIPFVKVGDITKDDNKFLYSAENTVNELGKQQSRFIKSGTFMLTNSGATLGVPKITKIDVCFNDGSQAFLNLSSDIFIEYLYYFFRSKTHWLREVSARGQGQPNLNTDMVKIMKFPVPPLPEQRRLVAYLDGLQAQVTSLRAAQAESERELAALMPSVLDRAFKGEL